MSDPCTSSCLPLDATHQLIQRLADAVISMGCGDACPLFPGKRYEDWNDLGDPAGLGIEGVRPIRDQIERRVRHLLTELPLVTTHDATVGTGRG